MENQAHHRDRLDASFRVVSLFLQEVESIMVLILASFSSFLSLTTAVIALVCAEWGIFGVSQQQRRPRCLLARASFCEQAGSAAL